MSNRLAGMGGAGTRFNTALNNLRTLAKSSQSFGKNRLAFSEAMATSTGAGIGRGIGVAGAPQTSPLLRRRP